MGKARTSDIDASPLSSEQQAAVRAQLDRILEHKLFRDTTRMKRFLAYVVEEVLLGRGARLKGYTIGLEVFDRPDDFDPQADTIVRVQAGQLRRRLDLYYAAEGEADPVRITVPKGRYAPLFEFRSEARQAEPGAAKPMLSLLNGGKRIERPGLAVMTFDDLTGGDNADFFAEGLTAEVVGALVQFRHLRVVAVRPTVRGRSPDLKVSEVGRQFDVQFVLSGSVRRAGEVMRVVVNLIDTAGGQILFQQTFDRQYAPDALFEIQESIASNTAAAIAAPFGQINRFNWRQQKGRRHSIRAYEAVLRYYGMGLSPRPDRARELLEDIEAITAEHTTFSTGFAIQALMHVFLCTQCVPPADAEETLGLAQASADRAVTLDTQNALGYFAAFQARYHAGDLEDASRLAQRAMALNPNDYTMLQYFALTQALRGETELSEAYDESSRRLIATPPRWFEAARLTRDLAAGRTEEAAALDVDSSDTVALWFLKLAALGLRGDVAEGRAFFDSVRVDGGAKASGLWKTFQNWKPCADLSDVVGAGWRKLGLDM